MSDNPTITKLRSLASLAPPTIAEQEDAQGMRARYLAANNGTGLQFSRALYQVKHSCGQWAWAEGKYCQHCGQPVELSDDQAAVSRPPPPREQVRPTPAIPPQSPPGSFNNPLRPLSPTPEAMPSAAPERPQESIRADEVTQQVAERLLGQLKAPGVVVADLPKEGDREGSREFARSAQIHPTPEPGDAFDERLDDEIQEYG
jgi:hypothetical protein